MKTKSNENGQIIFMLDLQGTLNGINDELTTIFMSQIEVLQKKFNVEKAIVFISSQTEDKHDLYIPADILKKGLKKNIYLDDCYYFDGIYNPNSKTSEVSFCVNGDKINVLKNKYLTPESNTKFIAIVDDNISIDSLHEFQNKVPFALIRPSQSERSIEEDGFSCCSSFSYGFDGVIDALDRYIRKIKGLNQEQIFESQKNELFMISGFDISQLFRQRDLDKVLSYLENDRVVGMGYQDLSYAIRQYLMENHLSIESNEKIKKIAKMTAEKIQNASTKRHV